MAEEKEVKKSNSVKIQITEKRGWVLSGVKHYKYGEMVEVDPEIYESMKDHVKHIVK